MRLSSTTFSFFCIAALAGAAPAQDAEEAPQADPAVAAAEVDAAVEEIEAEMDPVAAEKPLLQAEAEAAPEKAPWYRQGDDTFSYSYLEAGWAYVDLDGSSIADQVGVAGSLSLPADFYVRGSFDYVDPRQPGDAEAGWAAGVGWHYALSDEIDFILDGGYETTSVPRGGLTANADGWAIGGGLRGVSPNRVFELELRYAHTWLEDEVSVENDYDTLGLIGVWRWTDHLGLVAGAEWARPYDGHTTTSLGLGLRLWM